MCEADDVEEEEKKEKIVERGEYGIYMKFGPPNTLGTTPYQI